MWYRTTLAWLGDESILPSTSTETTTINSNELEPEFATNPADLANKPVAMPVTPDVVKKGELFAKNGKPVFFKGNDGRTKLIIHGTPNGYFQTGDQAVNSGDGITQNNGFVDRDGLKNWVLSKGYNNVDIIACYGGNMVPVGNIKSQFNYKGKLGFYTYKPPQGPAQFVFQKAN